MLQLRDLTPEVSDLLVLYPYLHVKIFLDITVICFFATRSEMILAREISETAKPEIVIQ